MKSKKAIEDGRAVRKRDGKGNYLMSADKVCSLIAQCVRKTMGDWMENNADIHAANGYFVIKLPYRTPLNTVTDDFWRKAFKEGIKLRRVSVGLALRAMRGEILTD
jgi:hypothetical protein